MKVEFFSDDLGLKMYTFSECTSIDVAHHLIENWENFSGEYRITGLITKRKYWLFGPLTVKIIAETEKSIMVTGGVNKEPQYILHRM